MVKHTMPQIPLVITHRGLEPSRPHFYPESSYQSFQNHIERGFGIEFDPNFYKGGILVSHDQDLTRITNGKDTRKFSDVPLEEICNIVYGTNNNGRIALFHEILNLITQSKSELHALHLKGIHQTKEKIDVLLSEIKNFPGASQKILIFDVRPEFAIYIKQKMPSILLAPSLAHEYDISRYNHVVNGTLLSTNDAIRYKRQGIYDWVWLDEWDRYLPDGGDPSTRAKHGTGQSKTLYNKENFELLRKNGFKIALVTPELHGTSPGLLAGESHQDALNHQTLKKRLQEIITLKPDAMCTDWPDLVKSMM